MKDFTKNIKLKFDADKTSIQHLDALLKDVTKNNKLVDDKDIKDLQRILKLAEENPLELGTEENKEFINSLKSLQKRGILNTKDLMPFKKETEMGKAVKGFKDAISDTLPDLGAENIGKKSAEFLADKFKDGIDLLNNTLKKSFERLNSMIEYTRMTNEDTRNYLFSYGLGASERYGLEQAMDLVGISDIEDIFWLQADQQKAFQEELLQETERYQKLYDSGYFEKMQQFNYEMANFKDDVEYEFMTFFIENKETIMSLMHITANAAKVGVEILGVIARGLIGKQTISDEERSARTKEAFYAGTGLSGTNVNVNIDNTFNNVAHSDQTWLANAGEMTYEQLIRALSKGGVIR